MKTKMKRSLATSIIQDLANTGYPCMGRVSKAILENEPELLVKHPKIVFFVLAQASLTDILKHWTCILNSLPSGSYFDRDSYEGIERFFSSPAVSQKKHLEFKVALQARGIYEKTISRFVFHYNSSSWSNSIILRDCIKTYCVNQDYGLEDTVFSLLKTFSPSGAEKLIQELKLGLRDSLPLVEGKKKTLVQKILNDLENRDLKSKLLEEEV